MKREDLLSNVGQIAEFLDTFEAVVISDEGYYEQEPIIQGLIEEATRLGVRGMPWEYLRQCVVSREKPAL